MRRIIFILSIALILCGCSKIINENKILEEEEE